MTNNFWKNRKTLAVFMILSSMILGIIFMLPKAQALPTNWTQNDWSGGENAEIIILNPAGGNLGNTYISSDHIIVNDNGSLKPQNIFTNPQFETNTNDWLIESPHSGIITHETTITYNGSTGSAKIDDMIGDPLEDGYIYQEIALTEGDYIISAYVYTGSAINTSILQLYFNGAPIETNYQSMSDPDPNGWYHISSINPITYNPAEANQFGIYINNSVWNFTFYVDNFELYKSKNYLNSNVYSTEAPRAWGNAYFTNNPNIKIKTKSGNTAADFTGNDFSACNLINSGDSIKNSNCVNSGDEMIQYQIELNATFEQDVNFPNLNEINLMAPEATLTITAQEPFETQETDTITLNFSLNQAIDYDLEINFNLSGTATPTDDFIVNTATPLIIPAGQQNADLIFTIIDDALYEADETIIINFENTNYATILGETELIYTIINTQALPIAELEIPSNTSELENSGISIPFDIRLDSLSSTDITIPLTFSGSATKDLDYSVTDEILIIPAGSSSISFNINILDDEIFENDEIFTVELSSELIGATLGDPISHTVTILNDDPMPEVNFQDSNSTFTEGDGEIFIEVDLDRPSYEDINLKFYFFMPETDIPQDFTINADCNEMNYCDLLIPAGETSAYISLNITDNDIAEEAKDTTIRLILGEPAPQATLGAADEHIFTINDDDAAGVTASTISNDTTEGGISGTFTVTLNTQPNADIEVTVASQDESEGTVDLESLIFTHENWDVPQTVTVTGVDDFIVDGDQPYWIQLNTFPSDPILDSGYTFLMLMPINVNNLDDDEIAVHVSPTSISTYEYNSPHEYPFAIVLGSQPDGTVIIDLMSEDESEGTISDNQIIFNDSNWNIPQEIILTSLDDIDQDGDITYSIVIIINPGSTDSTGYLGASPDNITVTNMDNDTPGITVSTISGNTTEAGDTATFTVVLDSQPTDDVTISLSSDNENEGTVNPSSLTFTNANWNNPQTVTITGVNDNIDDGDIIYNIIINSSSDDLNYHDFPIANVTVTNEDDDTAGITVSLISGDTNEDGGTAIFSIQLDSEPLNDVTIDISSDDPTEGSVNPTSITITPETWSTPRGITVTGLDDNIVDGNINYNIILAPAVSLDLNYDGLNPADVSVSNVDNDSIGFTVTQSGGSTNVTEGGVTDTYTIKLNTIPSDDVIITINTNAQINATPTTLTFTTANWNIAQTVTVTAVDDTVVEGNHTGSISHSVASADPDYNEFSISNITVAITDNDSAPSTGGGGGGGFWFPSHNPSETPVTPSQTPTDPQREQRLEKLRSMGVAVHGLVKIADDGNPNTTFDNIVYYVGSDGKRHVFPNADIYKTWYDSFRYVRVYPLETLSQIPLGDNVRYKPGVKMIKFTSNNRVYAVEAGGKLRWIHNEKVAWYMYGKGWQKQIVNIPDSLFPSYEFADDISHSNQFDFVAEADKSQNISMDLGL